MFLADTNIFLEILLGQGKKEACKRFLIDNVKNMSMTDFSLHSIGVILFRYNKEDVFQKFVDDVMTDVRLLSLPMEQYRDVVNACKTLDLDFDDTYQYCAAKYYGLQVVTMDKDFEKIKDVEVLFL